MNGPLPMIAIGMQYGLKRFVSVLQRLESGHYLADMNLFSMDSHQWLKEVSICQFGQYNSIKIIYFWSQDPYKLKMADYFY